MSNKDPKNWQEVEMNFSAEVSERIRIGKSSRYTRIEQLSMESVFLYLERNYQVPKMKERANVKEL